MTTATDKILAHDDALDRLGSFETPLGMTLIEAVELTSASATITLPSSGSISQDFRTLKLVWYARSTRDTTADAISIQFDGDTSSIYDYHRTAITSVLSTASALSAASAQFGLLAATGGAANAYDCGEMTIPGYRYEGRKTFASVYTSKAASAVDGLIVGQCSGWWRNASPIGSMKVSLAGACSLAASSMFALYGIY